MSEDNDMWKIIGGFSLFFIMYYWLIRGFFAMIEDIINFNIIITGIVILIEFIVLTFIKKGRHGI